MTSDPNALEDHHVGLLDAEDVAHVEIDLDAEEGGESAFPARTFSKLASGIATLVGAIILSYVVPGLGWAQPWRADEDYVPFWNLIGRELMGQGEHEAQREQQLDELEDLARDTDPEEGDALADRDVVEPPNDAVYPEYEPHADNQTEVEQALEFVEYLDPFYAALTRTDLGHAGAVTRVSHWGDSVLGTDGITGAIRLDMQKRFGDAGHGFHAITKYDASYRHKGIYFVEKAKWKKCFIIRCARDDGRFGYGGVLAYSGGGSQSVFGTAKRGVVGRKASRFELWYQRWPEGGDLRVVVDGGDGEVIHTRADEIEDAWEIYEVPDGAHEFSVRALAEGRVRVYGVVLEREGPGVVWDGMALIGSYVRRLSKQDPDHWAAQLQHRDPDLMVFTFGGNDMNMKPYKRNMKTFEDSYADVIQRAKQAKPDTACLIISPVDHGTRKGNTVVSRPIVAPMVESQRKVALREGCAFFDLYSAMGGEGSMGRWYRKRLGSPDLAHPSARGHKVIGALVYRALMKGYADFRRRSVGKPLP